MKLVLMALLVLTACSSTSRKPAQVIQVEAPTSTLDIWKLKAMAEAGQFDELNDLFYNQGISLDRLPEGYAAGAAGKVLGSPSKAVTKALDALTSESWRGKMFFPSTNPKISMGLNRIQLGLGLKIVPMASFVTRVLDVTHPTIKMLVPKVKSNVVILNYAHPVTKPYYIQETLLTGIQVYDVMVAVQGVRDLL